MQDLQSFLVSDVVPDIKPTAPKSTTLEAHHQQKMAAFQSEKQSLEDLEMEAEALEERLPDSAPFSDEARQLTDQLEALKVRIERLRGDKDRLNYFLDVGDMLFQYYDAQETLASGSLASEKVATAPMRMPANSVLSYFTEEPKIPSPMSPISPRVRERDMASVMDSSKGLNREKMLEQYLAIVEPDAIKSGIMPGSGIEPGWGTCPACDVELTFYQNEAMLGCPECGHQEFILVDSEKPSYKDPPREITYFAYKKINHFNEWLAQFQAKENTDIPADVIDAVLAELKKERIRDPKRVKKEKIHEILRKLKLSKMYDHVQQIKNRIHQQMTMLTLSKEMEEKLQFMFKEIQPAFIKYCPKGRSNFLSYPYVLYKLCQLLEMDEFLPCFQLLKSREKLYQQDQVWQQICREMGWQFIRSI
jgi:predicted  nucleic acid-binding Zn-ribbon protein